MIIKLQLSSQSRQDWMEGFGPAHPFAGTNKPWLYPDISQFLEAKTWRGNKEEAEKYGT